MPAQTEFRGRIGAGEGKLFLEAGGIRAELVPADAAAAAALGALVGVTAPVIGVQEGARILGAKPRPVLEAADVQEGGPDPALLDLLPLAHNPPPPLQQALNQLGPRLVAVRPGYKMDAGGAVPALVVLTKGAPAADAPSVPASIGDVRIDVQPASPEEQLLGKEVLTVWTRMLTGTAEAEAAPAINYTPPPDVTLEPCPVHNILCHVGPDAGWNTLEPFLDGTEQALTVAMYDFQAPHVIKTVVDIGRSSSRTLRLVLQEDKSEETDAVAELKNSWKTRLDYTEAAVKGPHRIFNNSFHTKVAVRDHVAFWLSSGNWSPHSQPEIPAGPQPTMYRLGNREWHVIIEDPKLSGIFEKFIEHDFRQAAQALTEEAAPAAMPDLLVPEAFFRDEEAAVVQPARFEPQAFATSGSPIQVEPLMTPDNYPDRILALIESAEQTLWMQYAYVRAPRDNDRYRKLVMAVAARMKAGLDVRVIVDKRNEKPEDIQALLGLGWKPAMMRLQRSAVHNKGILVDEKIAVVGSQNWSQDGTQFNRDASLVLHSPQIAKYFAKVFTFDWENLTDPVSSQMEIAPVIAPESGPTPPGMVRIPWAAWYREA